VVAHQLTLAAPEEKSRLRERRYKPLYSPSNAHSSPPRTSVVVLLPSGAEVWAELSEHLAVLEV
jgi:hypothetical protein